MLLQNYDNIFTDVKIRFLYISFIILATSFFLLSCSGSSSVSEKQEGKEVAIDKDQQKKMAMDYFIDGGVSESVGDYETAIKKYQLALKYDSSAGMFYTLAKCYIYLNKLVLALPNAQKAVELDSTNIDYYDLLSDVYNYGNKKESAISILEKAIKLDSSNVEINYKLARLYEDDKPLKALGIYNRILTKLGPDWSVLSRIAELQEKLGNYDESIGSIEKLLALDPENIPLKKMLIEFNLRAGYFDKGIEFISARFNGKVNESNFKWDTKANFSSSMAIVWLKYWPVQRWQNAEQQSNWVKSNGSVLDLLINKSLEVYDILEKYKLL